MESNADTEILRLWMIQAREEPLTPVDEIRTRAERLDTKTLRWRVLTAALFILVLIVEAWQVWRGEEMLERAGDLLTIAAFVYIAYRFRKQRLAAPPVALGRTNCIDFYRAELVRQRDLSKDSWGYLLPFVPGVVLALLGRGFENRPPGQIIAIIVFGVAFFLGVHWWNMYTARKFQREIDALDAS
jgi:hypothetical protein